MGAQGSAQRTQRVVARQAPPQAVRPHDRNAPQLQWNRVRAGPVHNRGHQGRVLEALLGVHAQLVRGPAAVCHCASRRGLDPQSSLRLCAAPEKRNTQILQSPKMAVAIFRPSTETRATLLEPWWRTLARSTEGRERRSNT
eukprot:7878959-Pyramimonas_sp.AAC.1